MRDTSKMKVVELRAELGARGLPTAGLKAELASRLAEQLAAEQPFESSPSKRPKSGSSSGAIPPPPLPPPRAHLCAASARALSSSPSSGPTASSPSPRPSRPDDLSRARVAHLPTAELRATVLDLERRLRESESSLAEERRLRAADAEILDETRESLASAERRLAHVTAEITSLRAARSYAAEENRRLVAELAREHGASKLAHERLKESSAKIERLEATLRERDDAARGALDAHRRDADAAAEARGVVETLRRQLDDERRRASGRWTGCDASARPSPSSPVTTRERKRRGDVSSPSWRRLASRWRRLVARWRNRRR